MDQAPTAFLEARLNELQNEVTGLNALVETYREIAVSLETKNCELRKKLRLLGHPEEPFDDGESIKINLKR